MGLKEVMVKEAGAAARAGDADVLNAVQRAQPGHDALDILGQAQAMDIRAGIYGEVHAQALGAPAQHGLNDLNGAWSQ